MNREKWWKAWIPNFLIVWDYEIFLFPLSHLELWFPIRLFEWVSVRYLMWRLGKLIFLLTLASVSCSLLTVLIWSFLIEKFCISVKLLHFVNGPFNGYKSHGGGLELQEDSCVVLLLCNFSIVIVYFHQNFKIVISVFSLLACDQRKIFSNCKFLAVLFVD